MKIVTLTNEEVQISFDDDIEPKSLRAEITRCIKHLYRYGEFSMPKNIMALILFKALKGCSCEEDHLDISQRIALYEYFKDTCVDDPYIRQFIKDTRRRTCVI